MKVLILVDCQLDFFEDGSLAVPNSNEIIPVINKILPKNVDILGSKEPILVIATRDCHPKNHSSFASTYGLAPFTENEGNMLWPDHCVDGTLGAAINPRIQLPTSTVIFNKGYKIYTDSYSAFKDETDSLTGLDLLLDKKEDEIFICGLASDYCIKATALDCKELGHKTTVISDTIKGVREVSSLEAINSMKEKGINFITSDEYLTL